MSNCSPDRVWRSRAIALLEAEGRRSADTHLIALNLPSLAGIDIYLKDESSHPTGSLKHRLARSLFLYGICSGRIREGMTLVEASSGSTAVSEAYYARLLGLDFCAVLPRTTSASKVEAIEQQGGRCHFVEQPAAIYARAAELAAECGGHYLDQFTFAERATDWRGNNNIAESIFSQMARERHPVPEWIVMGAGTGGTSATIGRYIRYRCLDTRLCVPDVEFSAFYDGWLRTDRTATAARGSRIEGIGRPRVEASFIGEVIDEMIRVPDAVSLAGMQVLSRLLGRRVGASTGSNFVGVCWAAGQMRDEGRSGSIVSLICDSGERYAESYYNPAWLKAQGLDPAPHVARLESFVAGGGFAGELLLGPEPMAGSCAA
ncbi:cysteine synthase [Devosia sp. Root413D1]|uniref:PLP-dependent cysteine synthase family protein n=1 Tax=Devosia sp. Root413D1 TaxID=1736531 RepID=UPI0006F734D0|nr:PLP-dependent cysteine synthase family protein [Devosia sp. Root413D1]KQW75016.1 cysteine synthase [Devosia sp. Root413D1]